MKKLFFLAALFLTICSTHLQAQNGNGHMQEMWKSYLKDSVKLSDPLVDSVMAIRSSYMPQMRSIFMDQSATDADKQTKMQSLRSEMDVRYKSAGLTDDQIATIHQHEEAMRQQMRNRMGGGGGNQ